MRVWVNPFATSVLLACGVAGLWIAWNGPPSRTTALDTPGNPSSGGGRSPSTSDLLDLPPIAPEMRPFGLTITQPAKAAHTGTVVLLHGLGDTGNGWAPVGPQLNLSHLKFIYPTAPTRPITVNGGMRMPGWFDIQHLDPSSLGEMMRGKSMDPEGIAESIQHVKVIIDKEIAAGIPADRIVVGGFSQGGHIALKTALTHTPPLGGCVAMSTWLEPSKLDIPPENLKTPIFQGHGDADPLIPAFIGAGTHDVLEGLGCTDAVLKMYNGMGHSSCAQELRDLREFLLRVLPEKKASREEVEKMTAKELKGFIEGRGGSTRGLLEKPELLERALSLL